jgi:hypothetical protein
MISTVKLFVMAGVLVSNALAVPLTWTLSGVALSDGGVVSGTFVYDASTNLYSSINITTTTGSARTGATYRFVCGQDVPSCNGLPSTAAGTLNLTTNASNQSGLPALALLFNTALSNSGGTTQVSGMEATCNNAACTSPTAPSRNITGGSASAAPAAPVPTPLPTTLLLALTGMMFTALYFWWGRRHSMDVG